MERGSSLSVAKTNRRSCRKHGSVTAILVLLTSLLCAAFCQAQILGTGQLSVARRSHTATLLQDGKILIVGGDDQNGLVNQAEIFDPLSLSSSIIASSPAPRTDHTANLLANGRVLIIGGVDGTGPLNSTEFYSPNSVPLPTFLAGPALMRARGGHTATPLGDGKILIVGGDSTGSAEIYDPANETFSLVAGSLNTPRQYHSAVLLNTGKVLIVGGMVGTNTTLTSAEIYDPQTQTFTSASGAMQTPRGLALLRVLPDGKVQIIGGDGEFSMEMFDPETNVFIALAHVPPHEDYLNNILASRTRSALITTIIQQNPVLQGQPELTPEIIALLNRLDHTVTEIPQLNQALIAGGVNDAGQILRSATTVSSSAATVTTDRFDYVPGEIVTITGRGWQPNETVWMLLHEEPETHDDAITSSVADNEGNFTNLDFVPAPNDLNRSFTLTAIGQLSGFTTQTAFKDSPRIASVAVGAQTGILTYGTVGSATYTVTPIRGNNGTVNGTLSVTSGLPAGVTANFSPAATWTSNGGTAFPSRTLTLTTSATTPAGTFTFTVRAADGADLATNTGTLTIGKATPTITWANPTNITYGTALSGTQLNATASVPGSFVYTPASGTVLNAGNGQALHVDFTPTDSGNYNNASKDATINVLKAAPTINWSNPADITYGTALSSTQLNATASAVVNSSTVIVTGTFTYTPPSGTMLSSGNSQTLHVSFAPTDTTNYSGPVTKDVTINVLKKTASVTAADANKIYGDADPTLTATNSGFLANDLGPTKITFSASRATGENAGTYVITPSASDNGTGLLNNYSVTYNNGSFTINKKNASVTPNAASKTYGDTDPTLTGTLTGFLVADNVTATYNRTTGETVTGSPYTISAMLSPAGVLGNYNITYNTANFTINKKNASVTAADANKIYGDADPTLSTTNSGFLAADLGASKITFSASRATGENVGTYVITPSASDNGTGLLSNYNVTYNNGSFVINKRPLIITADAKSKIYGDSDPALTYQITAGSLKSGDSITGTLTRAAGENVGTYAITQGTLAISDGNSGNNYDLTFIGALLTINKRPITITADAKSKIYGDVDPALTYQTTAGSLKSGDSITGTLTRAAGENVGTYAITQGTLAISDGNSGNNYDLTFIGALLTINKRPITITTDAKSKVYGDGDPALTYQITAGSLKSGDSITGALTRGAGENVGTYAISQGTLAISDGNSGNNYNLTFVGANLTINKRPITITADAKSKVYGDADPALTYQITSGSLKSGDSITGSLTRSTGENVGTYAINQGTLAISDGNSSNNYDLTFIGALLTINKRPITITVDVRSKIYGDADPTLTYQITAGSLKNGDSIIGSLTRAPGENVGTYAISQGTLAISDGNSGTNYDLTFIGAVLTINKRPASVTPNAASKTYGTADPAFTGTLTSFLVSDGVTATYDRTAGESVGTYTISATLSPAGVLGNYDITYNTANFTINKRAVTITADAKSKFYGDSDPTLTYQITSGSLGFSDTFTGALSRVAGENVGLYDITQGTLSVSNIGNYELTYVGAKLEIKTLSITVTPTAGQNKTYGQSDPVLTYGFAPALIGSDIFSGHLSRDAGEDAGLYNINQGTLELSNNYTLNFTNGVQFTINKANATINVVGYTGIYDGNAHGASGSATGVGGANLNASLNLGASFINVPGGTAHWTFTGGTNYNDASGDVAIVINRADATINVVGFTGVYDSNAHGASGSVTGVSGANLNASLNLGATFTNVPGGTAHWTFTGGTNYNDATGDVAIVINKANATINVVGYTGVYDGAAHGASGTARGIGSVNLNASLNLGATFINVPGGTAHWTFTGGTNYNDATGDATIVINKRPASVTPSDASKLLGALDPVPLTGGTLAGFLPADGVTATYGRTPGEAVAGSPYAINAALSPAGVLGNYNITYNTARFYIYYNFAGFFRPIDNLPVVNVVNAGSSVPIKFSLNGNQGMNIFAAGYPKSAVMSCNGAAPTDFIDEIVTPGSSGLTYDPGTNQYHYVWKTEKSWSNTCRQLAVQLSDGKTYYANFQFKK